MTSWLTCGHKNKQTMANAVDIDMYYFKNSSHILANYKCVYGKIASLPIPILHVPTKSFILKFQITVASFKYEIQIVKCS